MHSRLPTVVSRFELLLKGILLPLLDILDRFRLIGLGSSNSNAARIRKKCRVTFQQLNFANQVIRDTVVPCSLHRFFSQLLKSLHQIRPDLEIWVIIFRRRGPSSILVVDNTLVLFYPCFSELVNPRENGSRSSLAVDGIVVLRFIEKISKFGNILRPFKSVRLAKTLKILPCLLVQFDIISQNVSNMLLKVFSNDHLLAIIFFFSTRLSFSCGRC